MLMMSAWDDGDAGTFDLASDHEVAAPGGGVVASLSRSVVDDCAAEEGDGAVVVSARISAKESKGIRSRPRRYSGQEDTRKRGPLA